MKRYNLSLISFLLFLGFSMGLRAGVNPKPFVIPELKVWQGAEGTFVPTERTRIVYPAHQQGLKQVADLLAEDCLTMFGYRPEVVAGKERAGDVALALRADKKLGSEGYAIRITDRIRLTAPQLIGVYWGTRTLLQIAEQNEAHSFPQGALRDFPDYAMRGFMIDCGRKFIPIDLLRDYVKMMSYYKMNTFQIHLNDNGFKKFFENDWAKTYAAFRLESDTFPGLAAQDGYYTKREFVDLQVLAENRFVEIIPEIDAPAHTLAFAHYKPELGSREYGMDHLDLFNPETYRFMDALWKEYLGGEEPVFRGKRVHIGTDEYSNKKKEVVEKFREFTDRYIRYVEGFGKQACLWGALTHAAGETPVKAENVIMGAWYNGYAEPKEMVKQGYRLISVPDGLVYIVPAAGYYYDYLNTAHLYKNWTPARVGKVLFDEADPAILGGMFALWNDHVGNGITTKDIHHRVYPALQTLAVKMWTGKQTSLPFEQFDAQRLVLSEAPGVNQLGRLARVPGVAYEQEVVVPQSTLPCREIGYNYRVTFEVEVADEVLGTELFRSPHAVFYLSDPIRGLLGFARDGYLNTFNYRLHKGDKLSIEVGGDNWGTTLWVNGRLVEELNPRKLYFNEGKDSMTEMRTLVFPLQKAGAFRSRVTQLKVYQQE